MPNNSKNIKQSIGEKKLENERKIKKDDTYIN